MTEFTKEKLISWADRLIEETYSDIEISRTDAHAESYHAQLALLQLSRTALTAGTEQGQVAEICQTHEYGIDGELTHSRDIDYYQDDIDSLPVGTKLYAAPQLPQPTVPDELPAHTGPREFGRPQAYVDGWNSCRAAMLQAGNHAEQHLDMVGLSGDTNEKGKDGTLINECTMPVTQIKPVADLYGITSPTGSETTFTFDAGEASSFAKGGWTVQEYVELERYQEAVAGNSPVTPDGCIPVSDHSMLPPLEYLDTVKFNADCAIQDPESIYTNEFFLSLDEVFGEMGNYSEPVQAKAVSMLIAEIFMLRGYSPAEPQQEVKSSLEHGMQRYAGAMQKLADAGD
ncbi:hypothetical protein HV141_13285 [Citrobacter freundii]|nr:hypothetical protein [Citrobacter freundii]QLO02023.1 hypothetical protein HV141_13285 [Citrobacter freundii]